MRKEEVRWDTLASQERYCLFSLVWIFLLASVLTSRTKGTVMGGLGLLWREPLLLKEKYVVTTLELGGGEMSSWTCLREEPRCSLYKDAAGVVKERTLGALRT